MSAAHEDIAAARGGPVGAKGVVEHLHRAGFRYDDIARAVGAAPRSVSNWAAGRDPDSRTEARLMKLYALVGRLEEGQVFPADTIGPWFRTPTKALDWQAPIDLLEGGDLTRVEGLIAGLLYGYPT